METASHKDSCIIDQAVHLLQLFQSISMELGHIPAVRHISRKEETPASELLSKALQQYFSSPPIPAHKQDLMASLEKKPYRSQPHA